MPSGGAATPSAQIRGPPSACARMQREEAFTPDSTQLHVEDFFDCVRTRVGPPQT